MRSSGVGRDSSGKKAGLCVEGGLISSEGSSLVSAIAEGKVAVIDVLLQTRVRYKGDRTDGLTQ